VTSALELVDPRVDTEEARERAYEQQERDEDVTEHGDILTRGCDQDKSRIFRCQLAELIY